MNPFALPLALALLLSAPVDGMAQRRSDASTAPGNPVTLSGSIGGKAYRTSGPGTCKHAPDASIYDLPAALWMIEFANPRGPEIRQLNLTLWKPKDGSPYQVSLALETGSASHHISFGGKREPVGSATVKLTPSGSGGRFELKGRDAEGAKVELSISCPAFAGVEAEGG
ncbi:MAG TPA: hypothetical protein VF252_06940 [Gemmatimonadales bacterium]